MSENTDELAKLFDEGKKAYEQFDGLYDAIVPKRVQSPHLESSFEPEHPRAVELLENTTNYVAEWMLSVGAVLSKIAKARYKIQFNDPSGKAGLRGMYKLTRTEEKLSDILDDFELRLGELRNIIVDYETTYEHTLQVTKQVIEPANYDPKTRTIFFADEAIRFNKNAEYQPAICKLIFEKPEKLWEYYSR